VEIYLSIPKQDFYNNVLLLELLFLLFIYFCGLI